MSFFSPFPRWKPIVLSAVCAAITFAFLFTLHERGRPRLNPNISTPVLAVEGLNAQSLYYTITARDFLLKTKRAWISAHDTKEDRLDFAKAEQNPAVWRRLDRKYRFDCVLLCGDPSEYNNLLAHFLETKDWVLTYLDHTSMIFKRQPARQWDIQDFHSLKQKFANYPARERAAFLTQCAAKLLAIGQLDAARQQLDESMECDGKSVETWVDLALYEMHRGKFDAALTNADHALEIDQNSSHALSTKAQILYSAKRFNEALRISEQLVQDAPENPNVLFFHAKIAHEAHAYAEEIPTLKHLVEIVENQHEATAGFRIYLGQAYARDGQAAASLQEFEKAQAEGGLSHDQRDFIDEAIQTIKSRTAL